MAGKEGAIRIPARCETSRLFRRIEDDFLRFHLVKVVVPNWRSDIFARQHMTVMTYAVTA